MTELQRQFMEETGVSFDGIPINGVHLEYITWLEAQIQALRQPLVSGSLPNNCIAPLGGMFGCDFPDDSCEKCRVGNDR